MPQQKKKKIMLKCSVHLFLIAFLFECTSSRNTHGDVVSNWAIESESLPQLSGSAVLIV